MHNNTPNLFAYAWHEEPGYPIPLLKWGHSSNSLEIWASHWEEINEAIPSLPRTEWKDFWEGKSWKSEAMEYTETLPGDNFTSAWIEVLFPDAKIVMNSELFSTLQSLLIISQKCKWVWCLWDCLNGLDGGIERWWELLISPLRVAWMVLKCCLWWTPNTVYPASFSSSPKSTWSMYWAYQTLTRHRQRNQLVIPILSYASFASLSPV